ncbi:MAG: response regulator [Deinococcus-Thermus bacterium]|jgi:DNA-binding NarL/FixJ family response regulator|nr:response regulator [Deinococcota bacterium]
MTDDLTRLRFARKPTAAQPLMGLTILAVEDSRFACEALRLLAMRSGARLRRADSLAAARRHLSVYRPNVAIVDLGLPDGNGADLIADISSADVAPFSVLGISGDPGREAEARTAGADGFIEKPVGGLAAFQAAILAVLPDQAHAAGPRAVASDEIVPDALALKDDLAHADEVLAEGGARGGIDYAAQFVASVARAAKDAPLAEAAQRLARSRADGGRTEEARGHLHRIVRQRLAETRPI